MEDTVKQDALDEIRYFKKNADSLILLAEKIINKYNTNKLELTNKKDPHIKKLNLYKGCLAKTEESQLQKFHRDLFKEIFFNHEQAILEGRDGDWLRKGTIEVIYGSNLGNNTSIILELSYIFGLAHDIRIKALSNEPDNENNPELYYGDNFLLHLYRIFKVWSVGEKEISQINGIISNLEEDLGISSKSSGLDIPSGNELQKILQAAGNMMGGAGADSPLGGLGDLLGGFLKDEKIKGAISNMMNELKDCKDISEVVGKAATALGNPDLAGTMSNLMGSIPKENMENVSSVSEVPAEGTALAIEGPPVQE